MGALPLVMGALGTATSVAGTISGIVGGGGTNQNASTAMSVKTIDYLKQKQRADQQIANDAFDSAAAFADATYSREMDNLTNIANLQQQQLNGQETVNAVNFAQQQQDLLSQGYVNEIGDYSSDFTNQMQMSLAQQQQAADEQAMKITYNADQLSRGLASNQLASQNQLAAQGRANQFTQAQNSFSSEYWARNLNLQQSKDAGAMTDKQIAASKLSAGEQYGLSSEGRANELTQLTNKQALEQTQGLLSRDRQENQLRADAKALGLNMTASRMGAFSAKAQAGAAFENQMSNIVSQNKAKAREISQTTGAGSSSTDMLVRQAQSGSEDVNQAIAQAKAQQGLQAGTAMNQSSMEIAQLRSQRTALKPQAEQARTQYQIESAARQQELSNALTNLGLADRADQINMFIAPQRQYDLQREQANLNTGYVSQGNQIANDLGRANLGFQQQANQLAGQGDQLQASVLSQSNAIQQQQQQNNILNQTGLGRTRLDAQQQAYDLGQYTDNQLRALRDESQNQQSLQNNATYNQNVLDISNARRKTKDALKLGQYTADQARLAGKASGQRDQIANSAQSRSQLAAQMSGIQTQMLQNQPPQQNGVLSTLGGIAQIGGTLSGAYNQYQNNQNTNNYYEQMSNL